MIHSNVRSNEAGWGVRAQAVTRALWFRAEAHEVTRCSSCDEAPAAAIMERLNLALFCLSAFVAYRWPAYSEQ